MLFTGIAPQLSPKHFEVAEFGPTYRQLMLIVQVMLTYIVAAIPLSWAGAPD